MSRLAILIPFVLALCFAAKLHGQILKERPAELDDVGIREQLNNVLPLSVLFRDSQGQQVALGEFFNKERPVPDALPSPIAGTRPDPKRRCAQTRRGLRDCQH